ncbi:mycofactocin precursor [Nocardioides alpinus]|uniref:Mycofactocin n=1 Tax=Nocardioides alpinus TaxID=748909 RepID=A0A1I1B108_9ACTN|nr:mycofactocin precursor MftA [Nocardioides alpinus]PKH40939.1 mycofactocin precursor [Nocardioides alpinus]SFB42203.1 mycofactocin precursor [Nocardioides alpinus]
MSVDTDQLAGPDQDEALAADDAAVLESEDLIEEVSIDGMCGVY